MIIHKGINKVLSLIWRISDRQRRLKFNTSHWVTHSYRWLRRYRIWCWSSGWAVSLHGARWWQT